MCGLMDSGLTVRVFDPISIDRLPLAYVPYLINYAAVVFFSAFGKA